MAAHVVANEFEQDCEACQVKQDTQAELRERWGCDGPRSAPVASFRYRGEHVECLECPRRMLAEDTVAAISFYPWLKEAGAWPTDGGVLDQCATFVHAMEEYASALGAIQDRQVEEAKQAGGR